jgi:hypothetical protein
VHPFAHNNVLLLILDLVQHLPQRTHLALKGIRRLGFFGNVDNAMDVEGDLLGVDAAVLVGEAVGVAAIKVGLEGVVAGGDRVLRDFKDARGVLDLLLDTSVIILIAIVNQISGRESPHRPILQFPSTAFHHEDRETHPKVYIQISSPAKLPISDLECNCHPVISMQCLMKALSTVRMQLNVVSSNNHSRG